MALPTAAELDILAVLWRLGTATVREVHDELGKDNGYTTTLKQMQVMTEKGLLIRGGALRIARLRGQRSQRANAAADRGRPAEKGFRRFGPKPGDGRAGGTAGLARRIGRNPRHAGLLC